MEQDGHPAVAASTMVSATTGHVTEPSLSMSSSHLLKSSWRISNSLSKM
jgi:hypothetical protein